MLALFVFTMFFWMFITVLADMWTDPDSSGGAKAGWTFFIVVLPWVGILIYLIAKGSGMAERAMKKQQAHDDYIRQVAGSGGSASELATLADLKEKGHITQAEFDKAKADLLA
jgi:hypothetical protein